MSCSTVENNLPRRLLELKLKIYSGKYHHCNLILLYNIIQYIIIFPVGKMLNNKTFLISDELDLYTERWILFIYYL